MDSPLSLPPLQQAVLDAAVLDRLFDDLRAFARVKLVRPRAGRGENPTAITLSEAREGLTSGGIRGVQIHYSYQNRDWCDTLLKVPSGVRLVRISDDDIAASVAQG